MQPLDVTLRTQLEGVSVATLSTVLFKRGLRGQVIQDVHRINPGGAAMAGPAVTLRTIPAREDLNPLGVFENPEHPQRRTIDHCPEGAVVVVDSRKDARAATAGGILIARLMVRGAAGIVTDGGFRDAPEIKNLAIPAYHRRPAAPIALVLHQVVEANVPIACGDAPVWPGDIMVGDDEAVVVIPRHLAADVAAEAHEMTVFEDFVTAEVLAGRPITGLYPPTHDDTKARFAAWRAAEGR